MGRSKKFVFKTCDHTTLTFCGSVFSHNTSFPLYSVSETGSLQTIYLSLHPDIDLLAWGNYHNKGRTTANRTRKRKRDGAGSLVDSREQPRDDSPAFDNNVLTLARSMMMRYGRLR